MPSLTSAERRLSEVLLDGGAIDRSQLDRALEERKKRGRGWYLADVIVELGFMEESEVLAILGGLFKLPVISYDEVSPSPDTLMALPAETVRKQRVFPVFVVGQELTVAVSDPSDFSLVGLVEEVTRFVVRPVIAGRRTIDRLIERYYSGLSSEGGREAWELRRESREGSEEGDVRSLKRAGQELPVVEVVDRLLLHAVQQGASDIHLEPVPEGLRTRFRIDGVLYEQIKLPRPMRPGVISRIKILAGLDIAERQVPQDGRIEARIHDREVDLRISTLPVYYGEKIVIRILDKSRSLLPLDRIGFSPEHVKTFRRLIAEPNGLVLVTGPTGSGKTTTLYSALAGIDAVRRNVVTVEDPVEYQLPNINQVAINPKQGRTFASVLRSILRQDPDVVLVGEIRDPETGAIAAEAALTGHLVFSTLHTNDAVGAVTRLVEIGVEPYMIAPSLRGVVAQRLVRTICSDCRETYSPDAGELESLGLNPEADEIRFFRGKGCPECHQRGFRGRVGLFEIMTVDDTVREIIAERAPTSAIREHITGGGFRDMRYDGLRKIAAGLTTSGEVLEVTRDMG